MKAVSGRGAIRRMSRRWRLWVWVAISVGVFGLVMGLFPLFNVMGYELALACAVFGAVSGLDLGAAVARELQWMDVPAIARAVYPGRALARTCVAAAVLAVVVVLPPALIAAVRGLWLPTCDWWFGVKAYVALPIVTAALAGMMGHVIGIAVGARAGNERALRILDRGVNAIVIASLGIVIGALVVIASGSIIGGCAAAGVVAVPLAIVVWLIAPHRSTVIALVVPIAGLALAAVIRFYAAPPVFTYNALIGYFPGNLYDENIQLGMPLLWSRVEQLAWAVALAAVVASRLDVATFRMRLREPRPAGRRVGAIAVAVLFGGVAIALHWFGGALGYRIDADEIQAELDGRVETEHFIIHYARTPEIERDIALIALDHELRYAQVVGQIGVAPSGKLRSYYFASSDQKARWMGARDVEMAKPWRREIYLDHRAFPHTALRHEIAHAVASAFGDPIFGVAARRMQGVPTLISPGLVEGLAVALDWPGGYERLTPHEAVRAMQAMGFTPTIGELLSLAFLTVSSARSYTTAGSFLKFLLDRYGAASLRVLYGNGGDFERAYGKSMHALEDEWRAMISAISLPADEIEATRERFRHGSVFARPCPHANAARRERAAAAAVRGDRRGAIALMRAVCNDAPDEPRYRLELGDFLSLGDGLERVEGVALWTMLANSESTTSTLRAEAFERLARVAAAKGDYARTTELVGRARLLPVDANARRQLEAEWFALQHRGPAGAALRGYFFVPVGAFDAPAWALLATLAEPDLGIAHYLMGLQKTSAGEWQAAAEALDLGLARGLPSTEFVRNGARKLALVAYRAGDTARVERAIGLLRGASMTETDRLLAEDWAQRLAFDKRRGTPPSRVR